MIYYLKTPKTVLLMAIYSKTEQGGCLGGANSPDYYGT
jgi:hypothetical protein